MRYFRIVVVAAAAAAATAVALTFLAGFAGIWSICTVYSYRIMPSCRRLLRFIVLMKMNDVKQESRREKSITYRIIRRCTVKHSTVCTYS